MTIPAGVKLAALIPFQAWSDILGVRVTARTVPVQEHFYGLHANPTPIGFFGWLPDYPDPDTYLRLVFQSTSVNNVGRWRNARFDALVERAQAATDQRDRMALYHEADRLLVTEEAVIVPLGYHRTMWLVSPRIEGWWSSPVGAARIADLVTADTPAR